MEESKVMGEKIAKMVKKDKMVKFKPGLIEYEGETKEDQENSKMSKGKGKKEKKERKKKDRKTSKRLAKNKEKTK